MKNIIEFLIENRMTVDKEDGLKTIVDYTEYFSSTVNTIKCTKEFLSAFINMYDEEQLDVISMMIRKKINLRALKILHNEK